MNDITLVAKAMDFAAQKHTDQRRKGSNDEPYINHPAEVAYLLASTGADVETVAAGYLHDTVEDTETKHEEILREFGENISDIIREVTDDKSLPKAERKRLQLEHAKHASPSAKQVKIADKTSNLRSLFRAPPAGWDDQRKLEYINWSKAVVDNCRGVNAGLEACFDEAYKTVVKSLKPTV